MYVDALSFQRPTGHRDAIKIGPVLILKKRRGYERVKYLNRLIIHLKIKIS